MIRQYLYTHTINVRCHKKEVRAHESQGPRRTSRGCHDSVAEQISKHAGKTPASRTSSTLSRDIRQITGASSASSATTLTSICVRIKPPAVSITSTRRLGNPTLHVANPHHHILVSGFERQSKLTSFGFCFWQLPLRHDCQDRS